MSSSVIDIFPRGVFVAVYLDNPQIFLGKSIKSKSVEAVTDICVSRTANRFGNMN